MGGEGLLLFVLGARVVPVEVLLRVLLQAEVLSELAVVVQLDLLVDLEVVLESLEADEQAVGQFFKRNPLQSPHFLIAALAVVGILPLQHLALHQGLEGLLHRALDIDLDRNEVLLALRTMLALLGDDLVRVYALVYILHEVLISRQQVLDLVEEDAGELLDIHLLEDLYHGLVVGCLDGPGEVQGAQELLV